MDWTYACVLASLRLGRAKLDATERENPLSHFVALLGQNGLCKTPNLGLGTGRDGPDKTNVG